MGRKKKRNVTEENTMCGRTIHRRSAPPAARLRQSQPPG
jgi:hypothetical protein